LARMPTTEDVACFISDCFLSAYFRAHTMHSHSLFTTHDSPI
jgi:hypothetical protein